MLGTPGVAERTAGGAQQEGQPGDGTDGGRDHGDHREPNQGGEAARADGGERRHDRDGEGAVGQQQRVERGGEAEEQAGSDDGGPAT